MADPNQNPFAGLITSESLKQKRFGEVMGMAGDNPNAQMAQRAVFNFTEQLRAAGHGLTPEDIKAQRNDSILQTASQRMGERIQQGQMDPQDALAETLEDSFQEFLKAGDAESAAVIAPHIFAQRAKQAELAKLKAETKYVEARPGIEETKAEIAGLRAEAANDRARTQMILDVASANLKDRTDPNLRGPGGAGGMTTRKGFTDYRTQGASVVGLLRQLGDMHDMYVRSPGIASNPASLIAGISDNFRGAKELVAPKNKAYNYELATKLMSQNDKRITAMANTLNVDKGLLESTITDTAYAIARAREPGGRISNNDFDAALKILGSAQDPERAKAVLIDLGRRTFATFEEQTKANPDFKDEPVIGQAAEAWTGFLERAKGKSQPPAAKSAPSTQAQAPKAIADMTDEELQRIANGG